MRRVDDPAPMPDTVYLVEDTVGGIVQGVFESHARAKRWIADSRGYVIHKYVRATMKKSKAKAKR